MEIYSRFGIQKEARDPFANPCPTENLETLLYSNA